LNFPPVVPGYRSTATATPKNNRGTGEYFEPVDYTCRRRIHDKEQPLSLDPRSSKPARCWPSTLYRTRFPPPQRCRCSIMPRAVPMSRRWRVSIDATDCISDSGGLRAAETRSLNYW